MIRAAGTVEGLPHTFAVGDDVSPDAAARAVRGLRALAEAGREAERALAELASHGFHDAPAPVLDAGSIRRVRLQKILEVSEADLPEMSWSLDVLSATRSTYCGHNVTVVDFKLTVPSVVQVRPHAAEHADNGLQWSKVFEVRIGKKACTLSCPGGQEFPAPGPSVPNKDWRSAMKTLANDASVLAVKYGRREDGGGGSHSKTVEMRALYKRLFMERHSDEVLRRSWDSARVAAVMLG